GVHLLDRDPERLQAPHQREQELAGGARRLDPVGGLLVERLAGPVPGRELRLERHRAAQAAIVQRGLHPPRERARAGRPGRALEGALAAAVAVTLAPAATATPLPNLVAVVNPTTVKTFRPDGSLAATLAASGFASIRDTRIAIDAGSDVVDVHDARTGSPRY